MAMRTLRLFAQTVARQLGRMERGQALAETAFLLSFIALFVIAVLLVFGPGVSGLYESFFDEMP
jgi:Flp pilus assembly pilin Flp